MDNVQQGPFPLDYNGYVASQAWMRLNKYHIDVINLEKEIKAMDVSAPAAHAIVKKVNTCFWKMQQHQLETKGLFFVTEGIDGVGKSTQHRLLVERLMGGEREVISTREPGGTPTAEKIREFMFAGGDQWHPTTDLLLMLAARNEHIEGLIKPAMDNGDIVVSDRFCLSTLALQGASGVDDQLIRETHKLLFNALTPDLTIILDMEPGDAQQRLDARSDGNFIDHRDLDYHTRVRDIYTQFAYERLPWGDTILVSALGSVEDVHERIWVEVIKRYPFLEERD